LILNGNQFLTDRPTKFKLMIKLSTANIVGHHQGPGGLLCGRGGDKNREASSYEDRGAEIENWSHPIGEREQSDSKPQCIFLR
jgi:hypothetical protein